MRCHDRWRIRFGLATSKASSIRFSVHFISFIYRLSSYAHSFQYPHYFETLSEVSRPSHPLIGKITKVQLLTRQQTLADDMRPIAFAEVSLVSLLFSRFLIRAGAYAIDDSCKPYEFDKKDKTQIIESAMSAAHNMAVNAANKIVRPETITYMDDTRALLFPKSTTDTWNLIQGMTLPLCRHAYEIRCLIFLLMLVYGVEIWSNPFPILCR